jgi:hypothetical protein
MTMLLSSMLRALDEALDQFLLGGVVERLADDLGRCWPLA